MVRNILEYPMTHEEAASILDAFKASVDPALVGDVRPYAIEWIKEKLKEHQEMTK